MAKISVQVSPRVLMRDILVSGVLLSAGASIAPASAGELLSGQNIGMVGGAVAGGLVGNKVAGKNNKLLGTAAGAVGGGVLGGVVGGALSR